MIGVAAKVTRKDIVRTNAMLAVERRLSIFQTALDYSREL
jgi:hypothetical protein